MAKQFVGWDKARRVFCKEVAVAYRTKQEVCSVWMFSLTAMACVGLAVGLAHQALDPFLQSALFWIVLFFAAMAGMDRTFVQEAERGTLWTLRVYAGAQAIFWGKFLYNFLFLCVICFFLVPAHLFFLASSTVDWPVFCVVLLLGNCGFAASSGLIGAIASLAGNKGGLFAVLSFPVLAPVLLLSIKLTAQCFGGGEFAAKDFFVLGACDLTLLGIASVLFDFLWRE